MLATKLEKISKRKEKALSLFAETKAELMEIVAQAISHKSENRTKIDDLVKENLELEEHIKNMCASVEKIDLILG